MQEDLKKIGLSENAIDVYLSLLKIGETSVGAVISDLRLHRQSVYNALEELEDRDLITKKIKNRVNHFKISNPDILVENAQKQEITARKLSKNIKDALKKSRHEHEINVLDGQEQIRRYIINQYKNFFVGSTVYIINGYSEKFKNILGKKFLDEEYENLRNRRKIRSKHLANILFKKEFNQPRKNKNMKLRKIKFLPYNLTHLATTVIWPNCVNIQSFIDHPFIIEIKNEKLLRSYLEHFKMLWKIAKK